jgi:anti-anti-sigma regulatory factor
MATRELATTRVPAPTVTSVRIAAGCQLVTLRGALAEPEARELERHVLALVAEGGAAVYVDLSRASLVAPVVVDSLVRSAQRMRQIGGVLRLASRKHPTGRYVITSLDPDRPERMFGVDIALDRAIVEPARRSAF